MTTKTNKKTAKITKAAKAAHDTVKAKHPNQPSLEEMMAALEGSGAFYDADGDGASDGEDEGELEAAE